MTTLSLVRRDPAPVLLAIGFALLYGPLLPELVRDWSSSGDFSHGFLVPVVSGALVWMRRHEIRAAVARPFLPGAVLLALGVLGYTLGVAASEFALQRTSMVAFLGGWILLVWGRAVARPLVFPVAFLLLMIPPPGLVWNAISFPLQLLATRLSVDLLALIGLEVVRAGNVIHLPNCSLEVAQACSGLRSLVTLLALGAVIAEGTLVGRGGPNGSVARWCVFLSAIPVAVAANGLRVAATTFVAARGGAAAVTDTLHDAMGLVMFAVALGMLWTSKGAIAWIESRGSSRSG